MYLFRMHYDPGINRCKVVALDVYFKKQENIRTRIDPSVEKNIIEKELELKPKV